MTSEQIANLSKRLRRDVSAYATIADAIAAQGARDAESAVSYFETRLADDEGELVGLVCYNTKTRRYECADGSVLSDETTTEQDAIRRSLITDAHGHSVSR